MATWASFIACPRVVGAADIVKANNTTSLITNSSWVGNTAPGANDIAVFNSTYAQSGATTLMSGGTVSWGGVRVTTGSNLVNISNTAPVIIGASGVDMSGASRDLSIGTLHQNVSHTWSIASGRTFTVGDRGWAQNNGAVVTITGSGSVDQQDTGNMAVGDLSTFYGTLSIAGEAVLTVGSGSSFSLAGTISGSGGVTKSGAGTYTLTGSTSHTGGTTVTAGTLALGAAERLPNTRGLTVSGGVFSLGGFAETVGAVTLTGGTIASGTLTGSSYALQAGEVSAILAGSAGLTKTGAGTVTLSAANMYSGTTTVSAGTLQVGNGGTSGSLGSGSIELSSGGTLAFNRSDAVSVGNTWINFAGGGTRTLRNDGSGFLTIAGTTGIGGSSTAGETFTLSGSGDGVINRSIAPGGASLTLRKEGAGTWTLTNDSNAYSGSTEISAGTLQVGNGGTTGKLGTGDITLNAGGTLAFNRSDALSVSNAWSSFTGGGTRTLRNDGSGLLTIAGSSGNIGASSTAGETFTLTGSGNGVVARSIGAGGPSLAIRKEGTGTWTLSNVDTDYSGATTITAGTLEITGRLGAGSYAQAIANGGELHINTTSAQALSGTISGSGLLRKSSVGTLTLSGNNSYSGGTVLAGGTLALGSAGALGSTGTLSLSGGTLRFSASNTTDYSARFSTAAGQVYAFDTNGQTVAFATGLTSSGGSLTKLGSGTLVLFAANTYSGTTTISAGTLRIADGGSLGPGTIAFPDGTLEFTRSTATSLPNRLSVTGAGSSPDLLNNGSGRLTIQAGTSIDIGVDNGETFTVGGSGNIVIEKSIAAGAGASLLVKTGAGTVTLTSGSNRWSGGTTIAGGVLQVGDGTSNGTIGSGTITITNGRLAFNRPTSYTVTEKFATFAVNTTPGIENNGAGLLTVDAASLVFGATTGCELSFGGTGNGLVNGDIAPGSALPTIRKTGAGTWTFNGTDNNYGDTDIQAGTLEIAGTLGDFAATPNYTGDITNAGSLRFNSTLNQILSGVISGTGALVKSNTGLLTLSASNTFTGLVRVEGGTLALGGSGMLAAAVPVEVNGGTFDIAGKTQTIAALNGTGGTVALGAGRLSIANATSNAYAGSINGTGALTKQGAGTLTLTGSNTYSGGTTLAGGSLNLGSANAIGSTGTVSFTGGTLQYSASNSTDYSSRFSTAAGQAYSIDTNGQSVVLASALTSSGGSLAKLGLGTLTLSGTNTYSGGTVVAAGRLVGTTASLQGAITNNAAVEFAQGVTGTYTGAMTGAGSLTKSGAGTLVLTGSSGYTGATTISSGTLQVGAGGLTGSLGSGLVTNDGTLVFNRGGSLTVTANIAGAGDLVKTGTGTVTLSGSNSFTGDTTISAGTLALAGASALPTDAVVVLASGATLQLSGTTVIGAIDNAGGTVTGGTLISSFTLTSSGTLNTTIADGPDYATGILKRTSGTTAVTAANTFTGSIKVQGGVLALSGSGSFSPASSVVMSAGATLDLGGRSQTFANLAGLGGTVALGTGTMTLANAANDSYGGGITGPGGLVKSGAGNLILAGTSNYTGATTVSAGRLSVNGALGNSPVTVLALAELGGSGSIAGPVSVQGGGTLSPGNSIASLSAGATSFAAGGTFEYEVDSTDVNSLGTAADLLVVSGNLDIASGTLLTLTDLASTVNPFIEDTTIFALISYSGTWNGGLFTYGGNVLADNSRFFVGDQQWQIDYDRTSPIGLDNFTSDYLPSSKFVAITAVPEPSTLVLGVVGIAGAAWLRRRLRKPSGAETRSCRLHEQTRGTTTQQPS